MIANTKQVQTMVNIVGQAVADMRVGMTDILAMRTKFQAINPSVVGTPLDGNLAVVNAAITALDNELSKAVWTQMISAVVESHENKALD